MKTRTLHSAMILAVFALLSLTVYGSSQGFSPRLIENETTSGSNVNVDLHFFDQKQAIIRYKEVELNSAISSVSAFNINDEILLNLFDDVNYTASVKHIEENIAGTVIVTLEIDDDGYAYAIIATTDVRTLAEISFPETGICYQITSDPISLKHYLIELDHSQIEEFDEHPALIPPPPSEKVLQDQERIRKELEKSRSGPYDPAAIDVLIVFTPAARTWGNNNGGGIYNRVAIAMATAQLVLSNSQTVMTMKLVYSSEITYTESGDAELDLNRFTNDGDGYMDIVHTWRNTYGADLCQLFSTMGGGIGWVLNTAGGNADIGFSISGVGAATSYTPIHEMGHNMGCGHHKDQNFQPGPALFDFSAGWRWTGSNGTRYCDIMTYESGTYFPDGFDHSRVPHFSNPVVNYWNVPTGDYTDGDNAWTLMQVKHVVAAYRATATINCLGCPAYNIAMAPNNTWNTHSSSIVANGCYMYRVNVTKGHTYTFQTGCGNGATANFDTYLTLYDYNCLFEVANDDGCEDLRSRIEWMADYTGYAYLKVIGWGTASGNFTLAFHRGDDIEWTGQYSSNWNYSGNWSGNVVPDNTFDVTIPSGTPYSPNIYLANAECKSLTIEAGATLNMGAYNLVVSNDVNIHGTFNQNSTSSKLYVYGDIFWQSGSAATATGSATIYVNGIWEFMNGANVYLTSGYVDFFGSGSSYIRSKDADSHFNHIRNNKTGTILGHSGVSTYPCRLNGNLYIYNNCEFRSYTSQNFHLGNFVNNMSGIIALNSGTFVFDGTSGTSHFMPGDYFNNVTISSSGTTTFDDNAEVRGNLLIESGALSLGSTTLTLKGNWTNNVGSSGFIEGTSRVIFNGSGHQYVYSNENFNTLEANMGAALRVNNSAYTITCNQYDWTAGGIDVIAGTFTALDLVQNGIYGGYWLNPGGTINLTNNDGYVDLNGNLNIFGGNFNVFGGTTNSYWPFAANASINMSGGVLDFKDQGITIFNSATYTLTENITGGTIRTSRSFSSNRTDFSPTAGIFEFYGTTDYSIYQVTGSTLANVIINKAAAKDVNIAGPAYDERSGILLSDGGKSNTMSLGSNFMITGNLEIDAGTLNIGAHELTVARNAYISGTLNMTNADGILNAGTYYFDWLEFKSGSITNITHGTINCYGWVIPRQGSSFSLGLGNTLYIKGQSSGGLSNFEPTATYGNVVIAKNAGSFAFIDGIATEPIIVNGSFTMSSENTFLTQYNSMTVHGIFTDVNNSLVYVLDWSKKEGLSCSSSKELIFFEPAKTDYYLEIDTDFTLNGTLIINNGGTVNVHGEFSSAAGSSTVINNGSFIADSPNHSNKGWEYLQGNLNLSDGLFEITNNSVHFGSTATTSVSGGIIRSGGAFHATHSGVFQPTGGVVEITGTNIDGAIYCYNGNYFNNLLINRTTGFSRFMFGEPVVIENNFTVDNGVLMTGASEISVYGNVTVNSVGKLEFEPGASLNVGDARSITINNGGIMELNGTLINQSKITNNSSGHYAFNVESGGTIAAEYALFEFMDNNGINIKPGAIVDHSKAFHNCTFRLGQSGGRLLTINNSQTLAINYASFPGSDGDYNVSKTVNTGVVNFMGYSGLFSGSTWEQDPYNRIHWGGQTAAIVALEGVEVVPGQDICFEATNTLTVGGGGTSFEVQNGGFVELVAGQKIEMLEGTHFHNGSYGLARITTTADYCSLPAALIAANEETLTTVEEIVVTDTDDLFFKVYPNPTTGMFTIELADADETAVISVEIYTMLGKSLLRIYLSASSHYQFNLSGHQPGIYLIRVMIGDEVGVEKLIKQ